MCDTWYNITVSRQGGTGLHWFAKLQPVLVTVLVEVVTRFAPRRAQRHPIEKLPARSLLTEAWFYWKRTLVASIGRGNTASAHLYVRETIERKKRWRVKCLLCLTNPNTNHLRIGAPARTHWQW